MAQQKKIGGGINMLSSKPKNFKLSLKRLLRELSTMKIRLVLIALLTVLSVALSIIIPKVLIGATNYLATPFAINFAHVATILLACGALHLISSAFSAIAAVIMAKTSQQVVFQLRNRLRHKLTLLPLKFYDTKQTGQILSTFTNDCDNISNGLQQSVTQILGAIITVIGIVALMLTINVWLTLIMLFVLPLSALLSSSIFRASQKRFADQQAKLSQINGHIEEVFQAHKVVKANNCELTEQNKFDDINNQLAEANQKSQFLSGLIYPLIHFVSNFSYVALAVVTCIFISQGNLEFGALTAVLQYSQQFNQPIGQIAQIANVLQNTIAGAERVFELLDQAEEEADAVGAITAHNIEGNIAFSKVDFAYDVEKPLFKNVSLNATSGQVIAIVGKTGAGKTTIVNLLMRFYEISGGEISIDGININMFTKNFLRRNIGMVLQDTWLFNGTIKQNIMFGNPDATTEQVEEAARQAQCHHFIETLPHGYDTVVNEDASNISNGQKQLLTIARAILAKPSILILDEATSSVDTRTELLIQTAMKNLMKGRTSFVIAHRLSTITNASNILVMEQGNIVEEGSHHALIKNKQGVYYNLWHSTLSTEAQE